jgi:hypothetical protein
MVVVDVGVGVCAPWDIFDQGEGGIQRKGGMEVLLSAPSGFVVFRLCDFSRLANFIK